MISNPFAFIVIVASLIVGIKFIERKSKSRIFELLPSIVIIYFVMLLVGNIKLFDQNVIKSFTEIKSYVLSSMIFLMLLGSDIKGIYRIKTKLLVSFFVTSFSIMAGFVLMWAVMGGQFEHEAHKAFGALSASWIGGTANMIAVASAVGVGGDLMGYCLITDSVCYAAWFAFLLFLTPHKDVFNAWTKAEAVTAAPPPTKHRSNPIELEIYTILAAVTAAFSIVFISKLLPSFSFVTSSFWVVVISTAAGIGGSFTRLSDTRISEKVGFWLLYFLIAFIAVGSSFDDFSKAWLFVLAGFFVIAIHALLITLYAKLFRVDLFTIGVASLANIGGVASAPLLAASFSKNLVSVGVIMSMLGYIIGTFCGLFVTYILGMM